MYSDLDLLIRNARILLPTGEFVLEDVQTRSGAIAQIAPKISALEADREIDAKGLTLLPRVIDPQVHFREPGLEHNRAISRTVNPDEV